MDTGIVSTPRLDSELAPPLFRAARLCGALREGRVQAMLVVNDMAILALALSGAYALRYSLGFPYALTAPPAEQALQVFVLLSAVFVTVAYALGMYRIRRVWRYPELVFATTLAVMATMAVVSTIVYIAAHFYHRLFLAYFGLLVIGGLPVSRYAWKRWLIGRHERGTGMLERRLLFVGDSPLLRSIFRQIERHPELGYRIVGFLPAVGFGSADLDSDTHLQTTATFRAVSEALSEDRVDQVIFANSPKAYAEFSELVALCQGSGTELKRLMDILVAGSGLVVLLPVFVAVAVLIKWDSAGPVFFRRRVIGAGGRTFVALKFRSMVDAAHDILLSQPELLDEYRRTLKIARDPRITKLGPFLRRSSIDELPQLINVLRGEMSLVGPRILGDIELMRYGEYQEKVLSIRPGITGLWQVSGRQETTFDERVQLDMEYVDNWSLGLDLKILLKTVPAVLGMRGAR